MDMQMIEEGVMLLVELYVAEGLEMLKRTEDIIEGLRAEFKFDVADAEMVYAQIVEKLDEEGLIFNRFASY